MKCVRWKKNTGHRVRRRDAMRSNQRQVAGAERVKVSGNDRVVFRPQRSSSSAVVLTKPTTADYWLLPASNNLRGRQGGRARVLQIRHDAALRNWVLQAPYPLHCKKCYVKSSKFRCLDSTQIFYNHILSNCNGKQISSIWHNTFYSVYLRLGHLETFDSNKNEQTRTTNLKSKNFGHFKIIF